MANNSDNAPKKNQQGEPKEKKSSTEVRPLDVPFREIREEKDDVKGKPSKENL